MFNKSIDGRLVLPRPSAAVCNGNTYDVNACTVATTKWFDPVWRSDQIGAMQHHQWENSSCSISINSMKCNQGAVPVVAVNATLPEHVQATIRFAAKYNLRLVIKNTGHDYLGRSTAAGSLLLWLHYMKNMTMIKQYTSCTSENVTNAARLYAGVQWGEAYQRLDKLNLTAIGGVSATVGAVGGFLQGGGHGPLTRWKGLAVDQVLEYDVITANGQRLTANACENSDLFWALKGAGGGTFAVVISAVLRTFPTPYIVAVTGTVSAPNETRFAEITTNFIRALPSLADAGWSGYFSFSNLELAVLFNIPNGNLNEVNDTWMRFLTDNSDLRVPYMNITVFPSFYQYSTIVLNQYPYGGYNVLYSSRLISESVVRNEPDKVAEVFMQMKANSTAYSGFAAFLVAGGQVSNISGINSSVNPAWRTALLHVVYSQGWLDTMSEVEKNELAMQVSDRGEILNRLAFNSQINSYANEADPNEPNWQERFYGSKQIYNQLKLIKDTFDPDGLFICKNCIGSDDWTTDLNCPKT